MYNFNSYSPDNIKAKIDIYKGDILVQTCDCSNFLEDFSVSRAGETGKFFGFGICHSLDINFIDIDNNLNVDKGYTAHVKFGDGETYWNEVYPTFHLTEVEKDGKNGSIKATGYDDIYRTEEHTWAEVLEYLSNQEEWIAPYSLAEIYYAICMVMGWSTFLDVSITNRFATRFETVNYEGTENLRDVLDDIAEATQTIYYMTISNTVRFIDLAANVTNVYPITKDNYYELNLLTPRTITGVGSTSELGENYVHEAEVEEKGVTQYIRDNAFWALEPAVNIRSYVETALSHVLGLTITQFECDWSGDYRLEIGDFLAIQTDSGDTIFTYLLNDTLSYDGTLSEFTEWEYTESEAETLETPKTVDEAIKQTIARVDKVNQEITLKVENLEKTVSAKLDKESFTIQFDEHVANGEVDKIVTATKKYRFDDDGMNITSDKTSTSTKINDNGMQVFRGSESVLIANDDGVRAEDLHATTYLLIGNTSRLEDFEGRTTCYWMGGL